MMAGTKRKREDELFTQELLELGVGEGCLEEILAIHRAEPDLVPYDCKRKYNITKNDEKLKLLKTEVTAKAKIIIDPVHKCVIVKRRLVQYPVVEARERSTRLKNMQPVEYRDISDKSRNREDNNRIVLKFSDIDTSSPIFTSLKEAVKEQRPEASCELRSDSSIVQSLENHWMSSIKVSEQSCNISSMDIHPGSKLLVACGSTSGKLSLCLFDSEEENVAIELEPQPVNPYTGCGVKISGCKFLGDFVYTCSHNSTIRMLDVEKKRYNEVYRNNDSDFFREMTVRNPNEILVASTSGQALQLDCRQQTVVQCFPDAKPEQYLGILQQGVWHVDTNQQDPNYFITSSDRVAVWDVRNAMKPVDVSTAHDKSATVSCAVFDPIFGKKILSVATDGRIVVSELVDKSKIRALHAFEHDFPNGNSYYKPSQRSSKRKYKVNWHPKSDELFIIGTHGRHVNLLDISGKIRSAFASRQNYRNTAYIATNLVGFHEPSNSVVGAGSVPQKIDIFH